MFFHRQSMGKMECTKVRFARFLSSGFITDIVVNPSERKLAKRTSAEWNDLIILIQLGSYIIYV